MTLQAHYTEEISASLEMNIYTAMFTVKVRKDGNLIKKMFDTYENAVEFFTKQTQDERK